MPDPVFIEQLAGALWVIKVLAIFFGGLLACRGLCWLVRG